MKFMHLSDLHLEKRAAELKSQDEVEAKVVDERTHRLETEEEMRVRIEAEVRAQYEAEAKARAEAEARIQTELETKAIQVMTSMPNNDTHQFSRKKPHIEDNNLRVTIEKNIDRLELYYPEGKIFALDSIDSHLREAFAKLYKKAGYATVDDLFGAYGFEVISGNAVRELRSFVRYTPGNEPDFIKPKIDNMIARLSEYYPDHVISRGIQTDHKKLSNKVSGLYQWLGYENYRDFLAAYGFEYNVGESGRPMARDYDELVDTLVEKYKNSPKPKSMGDLLFDNPDLKGPLKTLQNKSKEVYGMTLKKYFEEVGIFALRETAGAISPRTASARVQDGVYDALAAVYSKLDENEYGTAEEAIYCLEGMNVKQNKAGQIYIFSAVISGSTVTIPYGIDFISNGAFSGQQNIKEIVISAELLEVPTKAFADCISLERIEIPEGVMEIGSSAFANCQSLKSIVLPKSLKQIGSRAFFNCAGLTEVVFLNPMTMVGEDAFAGCAYTYEPPKEAEVTDCKYFNYSMDRKGNVTISGFNGDMEAIVIPGMIEGHPVTTIGKGAFEGCKNLVEVSMSDYISTVQGDSFRDCISLKKIHLSNGVTKIITTTFKGCISLKAINIPDGVTEIKKATFKDSPIEHLHIGKSLAKIDTKAFYNGEYDPYTGRQKTTRAINKITVDPANPYLKSIESMILSRDGKAIYAVLGNKKKMTIPEGVEVINDFAFEGLAFFSDVILPDSLVSIGVGAFANTALRSVTFGPNVRNIGNEAFTYCDNLTAAVFNEGLESIGYRAFADSPIVSVILPDSLRKLGEESFNCIGDGYYSNQKHQEFKIAESNPYLKADGEALYTLEDGKITLKVLYGEQFRNQYNNKKNLEYNVQSGTTHIGREAFKNCNLLSKVTLPEGLISIGELAFASCNLLKHIEIPNSVEFIGEFAFKGTSIKNFVLGENLREVGTCAFLTGGELHENKTSLRSIKVKKGNSIYYVDQNALMKRKSDGTGAVVEYFGRDEIVVLPDDISEICTGAFVCSIVKEVHIPSSVTTIGEEAFVGCSQLVRLSVGFAEPENGANFAIIYIPENKMNQYDYSGEDIRNQYLDCIRVNSSGSVFDFVKYDSLFETIKTSKDKILVATDRLKSAIQLVPLYRDKYLTYLRKNAKKAVEVVVEFDDLSGLNTLAELDVFTGKNIDDVIELANKAKKPEILSYLMNYKNSKIGISEEDYDL